MKQRLKIGIDLDEVVVDFLPYFIKYYNERFDKNLEVEDWKSYNFWDVIGGTKEEAIQLVNDFSGTKMFDDIELVEGSSEVIKSLADSNEIVFIISRFSRMKEKTPEFMEKHFDPNFKVIYTSDFDGGGKRKADVCSDIGIDIMIEDHVKYANECADKVERVFLLNKPWNEGRETKGNVVRVNGWSEIMNEINEMGEMR